MKQPIDIMAIDYHGKQFVTKFAFYLGQILRDLSNRNCRTNELWRSLWLVINEHMWYCLTKYMTRLKMRTFAKYSGQMYPEWLNGYLMFHLELRNFFSSQSAANAMNSGAATPSLYSLSRIPSYQELIPNISRGNSFECLDKFSFKPE